MIDIADCTLKMKLFSSLFSVLALLVFGHFSALSQDTACHGLVVRVLPAYDGSGNLTDYVLARIYARPSGDNDKVFMVFGNDLFPLEIDCGGTSAFNNPASGYTNEGIEQPNNPAYFNDSYVTIGQFAKTLDTPGSSTIASTELFPWQTAASTWRPPCSRCLLTPIMARHLQFHTPERKNVGGE